MMSGEMERKFDKMGLLMAYEEIFERCKLISKALDDNSIENAENELKACDQLLNKLIELDSFNHLGTYYASLLLSIQRQLKEQSSLLRKKAEKKSSCKTNSINTDLQNYEVNVSGQGFENIAGLETAKAALKSSVIFPFVQPQLFEGLKLRNCVLLYGPPGTGKTKLAIATAAEAKARFISITSSSILSHYVGVSEKNISGIFNSVKTSETPAILFIDEVDSLCRNRVENEPEHSRRVKTEILCQISNFTEVSNSCIICATNCPWELDAAFRRRFQRQIYVPLPNESDRYQLLKLYTKGTALENTEHLWMDIVAKTEGYSSSDIEHLIMQALTKPIERLQYIQVWNELSDGTFKPYEAGNLIKELRVQKMQDLPAGSMRRPEADVNDVLEALRESRRTVTTEDVRKFESYNKDKRMLELVGLQEVNVNEPISDSSNNKKDVKVKWRRLRDKFRLTWSIPQSRSGDGTEEYGDGNNEPS